MKKHGLRQHRFYSTWDSIMQRCNNPNCTNYKNYGARGITISKEFKDCKTFIEYLESLPDYSKDKQIDRINNDSNYERGNLKWSTRKEQNLNKRIKSDNTSGYTGVAKAVNSPRWRSYIYLDSKTQISVGIYDTIKEAVEGRNNYIITHKLTHKIQILNE
jgi:hypothetical protein